MSAPDHDLLECLKEGCASLGLEDPEKIRQILTHLSAVNPANETPAEPIPEPLMGIRDWVAKAIAVHQKDMARISIAIWFAWKLSLWKPDYLSLDHYYTDGCGFSPAQGDRLRHHGAVLVALALADVTHVPLEKQARVVRKIVPGHLLGDFFRTFYSTYDRSVHCSASATKKAAQRYAERQILTERKRRLELSQESQPPSGTENGKEESEGALQASLPSSKTAPESPHHPELPTKTLNDLRRLLNLVAPGTTIEDFTVQCVEAEFRRIRKDLDSPNNPEFPLLDGLTALSARHTGARTPFSAKIGSLPHAPSLP